MGIELEVFEITGQLDGSVAGLFSDNDILQSKYSTDLFLNARRYRDWPIAEYELEGTSKKLVDVFYYPGSLAVSKKFKLELQPEGVISKDIQYLPVSVQGREYFFIHPCRTHDCLDQTSTVWRVDELTKERYAINEFKFIESRVPNEIFFRIPEENASRLLYASDDLENSWFYKLSVVFGPGLVQFTRLG